MTTVAYDGSSFAADTQMTTTSIFRRSKMQRAADGSAVFTAGLVRDCDRFVLWLTEGFPEDDEEYEVEALVLRPDGTVWLCSSDLHLAEITGQPAAIGSGSSFALGAMAASLTAQEAVQAACKLDPYSSPPVETWTVEALLAPSTKGKTTKRRSR